MFLKRDLGSPLNCHAVDAVLERHRVLPLNSPPGYPRYNGSMERGMRDLKAALDEQRRQSLIKEVPLALEVELATHKLNHRRLRSLGGLTPANFTTIPTAVFECTGPYENEFFVRSLSSSGSLLNACLKGTATAQTPPGVCLWKTGSAASVGSPFGKTTNRMCQPIPKDFSLRIDFALHV